MAGNHTATEVFRALGADVRSHEETMLLRRLNILDHEGNLSRPNSTILRSIYSANPDDIIYLTADGQVTNVMGGHPRIVVEQTEKAAIQHEIPTNKEALDSLLSIKSLSITADDVQSIIEDYVKTLPKTAENYISGEVLVKRFTGIEVNLSSLLAAGTKILDAILYMKYNSEPTQCFIFAVSEVELNKTASEISENILMGQRAIKAAFTTVYNSGNLPNSGGAERNVSKYIRETLFCQKKFMEDDLCKHLSSTNPAKFPAIVFMNIDLSLIPSDVASRCKIAIAGNKAIRYAVFATGFEVAQPPVNTDVTPDGIARFTTSILKYNLAKDIVKTLCELSTNFEAQKLMHPLNPKKPVVKDFTLKMTCAIVWSLSPAGRFRMREKIIQMKIEAFKRDINLVGSMNNENMLTYPVLSMQEADFSSLSVAGIKAAYGM